MWDTLSDEGQVVNLRRQPRSTPQEHFLVLISVRGRANPRAIVLLKRIGELK
jgi:hypothetical protein